MEQKSILSTYYTACITKNENIYVWGMNDTGQLGLGDNTNRSSPTLLTLPNNEKISFFAGGFKHVLCVTKNDNCYVWGFNKYGQLGLGDTKTRNSPTLLNLLNNEKIS